MGALERAPGEKETMINITKNDLATNVASTDPKRGTYRRVCLNRDGLVSTDGHRLLVIPLDGAAELGDAEILFSATEAAQVAKGVGKGVKLEINLAETLANGHVAICSADGTKLVLKRETDGDKFFDYRSVLNDATAHPIFATVRFSARYIAELAKALAGDEGGARNGHGVAITLTLRGDNAAEVGDHPIELACPNTGRKALLMPMRT